MKHLQSALGNSFILPLMLNAVVLNFAFAGEIHVAVKNGDIARIEALLKQNPSLMNERNEESLTPLHVAALSSTKEVVAMLLDKGADVNVEDHFGYTPLHKVAGRKEIEIVELLLSRGADVTAKDKYGHTPQYWALVYKDKEGAELLLKHEENVRRRASEINDAARKGDLGKVEELLKVEPALAFASSADGGTPLHYAVVGGHIDIVDLLISKGARVNAKTAQGATALHYAASEGRIEIARLLITKGADVKARMKMGHTPFDAATASGNHEMATLLQKQEANADAEAKKRAEEARLEWEKGKFRIQLEVRTDDVDENWRRWLGDGLFDPSSKLKDVIQARGKPDYCLNVLMKSVHRSTMEWTKLGENWQGHEISSKDPVVQEQRVGWLFSVAVTRPVVETDFIHLLDKIGNNEERLQKARRLISEQKVFLSHWMFTESDDYSREQYGRLIAATLDKEVLEPVRLRRQSPSENKSSNATTLLEDRLTAKNSTNQLPFRIQLIVQANSDFWSQYLRQDLRKVSDIVLVNEKPDFVIRVKASDSNVANLYSVLITRPFSRSDLVASLLKMVDKTSLEEKGNILGDMELLAAHWTGAEHSRLEAVCQELVARFDKKLLQPARLQMQIGAANESVAESDASTRQVDTLKRENEADEEKLRSKLDSLLMERSNLQSKITDLERSRIEIDNGINTNRNPEAREKLKQAKQEVISQRDKEQTKLYQVNSSIDSVQKQIDEISDLRGR